MLTKIIIQIDFLQIVYFIIVWGMAGWGISTREAEHDGIGRMLTAVLMLLTVICAKL